MEKSRVDSPGLQSRRFSWDAVSFLIPGNWELALYTFPKRTHTRIELEDEFAVRLEAEWTRPKAKDDIEKLQERYERETKALTARASHKEAIHNLENGWMATEYRFSDGLAGNDSGREPEMPHWLVTAFHTSSDAGFFCFMILYAYPGDKDDPLDIIHLIADEFRRHTADIVPWELYDIRFEIPRQFLLQNTLFDIGSKLMLFGWKLRRFYLWHFSAANMFLKDRVVMEEWVAGYLNGFSRIKGPLFLPGRNGVINWKRRKRHFLGHRDEISRWCFNYRIRARYQRQKKQLIVWVFNYRNGEDLELIPESLRFGQE